MLTVAVISGGAGLEHAVSMVSARNVLKQLNNTLFRALWIVASKQHHWYVVPESVWDNVVEVGNADYLQPILWGTGGCSIADKFEAIDVVIPMMHGTYGEDGHLQGFLQMLSIAYTSCGVMSSVLGMHKHIFKIMMQAHHVPVLPYYVVKSLDVTYEEVTNYLATEVLFVKPSASGSSIGVMQVYDALSWRKALHGAFIVDDCVIVEPFISGVREIECAVWMERGVVSTLGEIAVHNGYYNYENKYLVEDNVHFTVPAQLDEKMSASIQQLARKVCDILAITEYARVDFFVDGHTVYVNEINTIPGNTAISMFPRLLAHDGYSPTEVWTGLIMQAYKEK